MSVEIAEGEARFERGYVYRLTTEEDWAASKAAGLILLNEDDERDGFLHLSGPDQAQETARVHYGRELGLLALAIPEGDVPDLRWEESREGEAFPHAYGDVPASAVDHALRLTRGMGASYMVVARLEP